MAAIARRADVSRPTAYQALADLRSLGLSAREGRRHLAVLHAGRRSVPAANVRVFEGDDGLRDAWATLVRGLPRGATIWRIESPRDHYANKAYYPDEYMRRASSHRGGDLRKVTVTNPKTATRRTRNWNRDTRYVPHGEALEYDVTHAVAADRVLVVSFSERRAFLVKSAPLAAFYRDLVSRTAALLPRAAGRVE